LKVPSVGRTVHYVAPGSADGRYPPAHRAAVITEVGHDEQTGKVLSSVNIFVMNPTGTHHANNVPYDEECGRYTWHWPEYVPEE
jgi:hypothetical protein